ncbi:MAG: ATP-binding protein, partial [Deltaproteobacteria bacterium]|nr:ATP-binding protein [Deltaproteobacteria bacterium]
APRRARLKPERILHLAHRIKNVVGEMLHSFRQDHFNLEATDPAELLSDVRDALASRAAAQAVTLRLKVQTALHHLLVDRKLLRRALVNIGENGLDEMRDGGTLTLEVGDVPGLELLEFRVSDTGPGIPHELRKRVLESFFTTKEDSRGLGLSIAHGVVRGHEGRIRIEDRPGGGTLVAVELPRLPAHTGVTEDR